MSESTRQRVRPRRLRRTGPLRNLASETQIQAGHMVMPHFVLPNDSGREPIVSMPGIHRLGLSPLLRRVSLDMELGIRTVLLFGIPLEDDKDPRGTEAAHREGPVQRSVRALKEEFGQDLVVITDVCLCAYTNHGHCGVLAPDGEVDNDPSLEPLAAMAVSHAESGADMVAPSDMMDGRVGAIRDALDDAKLTTTGILSYAVKYSSAYYGPFREAAASAPGKGDRRGYQMDPRNRREAVKEALLDQQEGADMLMVKPALAYLDVISKVKEATHLPLAAYNVSGEFSAVKAASERGWLSEADVVRENLIAMRRAGADILITYHAREALEGGWL